ncbi:LLM class flavin-dependent oxidoreductase [Brasilonema sp. CT11]|nr:LLM class flavin-dependent oxidoreductase [Brasilonema sp. CT11]
MKFGLMFFASSEDALVGDKYSLVIESARFADRHGFSSVWTPERHFTKFGGLYPNPAVLNAALARETQQIRLQAGSVVLPIHNPIRVAEEWAVVDNLSTGRVGISFASGWNPDDFAFFPKKYKDRHKELFIGIETLRKLWRGESIQVTSGNENQVEIRIYPTPIQQELPIWVTAAGNPQTFAKAGEIGANVLTHLLDQDIEELAEKITLYRQARAKHGHNPDTGMVSIMLHTFVGQDFNTVREEVRVPYCEYLKSNIGLLKALAQSRGSKIDIATLPEKDLDDFVNFLFERFASSRGLIGTPETCLDLLNQLDSIGVDEVACLLDFGPSKDLILGHLPDLNQLRECYGNGVPEKKRLAVKTNTANGISLTITTEEAVSKKQLLPSTQGTLQEIRSRCTDRKSATEFYSLLHEHGFQLGRTFQGIEHLWLGKREALAQVNFRPTETLINNHIKIHPNLLEACHQVLGATLLDEMLSTDEPSLYLPVGLRSFQVHDIISNQIWSHAVLQHSVDTSKDVIEGDVRILDPNGKLLVEVSGLQMQRAEHLSHQIKIQDKYANWLYELQWQLKPLLKSESSPDRESGSWLIFADSLGIGHRLAELLEKWGETCFTVTPGNAYKFLENGRFWINPNCPEDMRQLIQTIQRQEQPPCRGVVHLWSLDATPTEETTIASLEKDQILSVKNALNLIQALAQTEVTLLPLWFVTRNAQPVGEESKALAITQAPLWGLGKVVSMEYLNFPTTLVDIEQQSSLEEAAGQLFNTIQNPDGEDQVVFRQAQRYVARLKRARRMLPTTKKRNILPDATYLITGGLGALGLAVAQWLVSQGVRHLVLTGRRQPSAKAEATIADMEHAGVEVLVVQADVSQPHEMMQLMAKVQASGLPLRGVVHAAGVPGYEAIKDIKLKTLESVLRPKVVGTWLLHQLTQEMELDFFVVFSSAACIWGSKGQAHYAAANAFLDVFAHYRHSLRIPTMSVNWGPWAGGMISLEAQNLLAQMGIAALQPDSAVAALGCLLEAQCVQTTVADVDWTIFKELYEVQGQRRLLESIEVQSQKELEQHLVQSSDLVQRLKAAADIKRQNLLIAYIQSAVAKVLGLDSSQIDVQQSLNNLGLDSLMAVELRNRVKTELGVDISIIKFIEGVSITALATEISEELTQTDRFQGAELEKNGQFHQIDIKEHERVRGEL